MARVNDEKKVNVRDLRPDMVLSRTVLSDRGVLLIPKGAMLNRSSYNRLREFGVLSVFVSESSINPDMPAFGEESFFSISEGDRADFGEAYDEQNVELAGYLWAVVGGENVKVDLLNDVTDKIMHKVKCKSDIFMYLDCFGDRGYDTYSHSANVGMLANLFGLWLGYDKERLDLLTAAGTLHDIGKTQVPNEILSKKEPLTDDELEEIRNHALYGYRIIERQNMSDEVKFAALSHHERDDGGGYPFGVRLSHVNEFARIIMICDVYDAMTSNRVYRDKICPFDAIAEFERETTLDRVFLDLFLQNIAYTYVGSRVSMSDGSEGEVMFINHRNKSLPMVRVNGEMVDLSVDNSIRITGVL